MNASSGASEVMNMTVIVGAIVTILGWFVAYYLAKAREDRTRRQELTVRHLERQIEEFYGPLFNLVHQIFVANHVQYGLVEAGKPHRHLSGEQVEEARSFFYERYFRQLHDEMHLILKTKLFLVEGADMPDSFYEYLRHSTQERVQIDLAHSKGIDTSFIPGVPWPDLFYSDIEQGLKAVMAKYEDSVQHFR
jgi:hypothetical protein